MNPINELQEFCAKRAIKLPNYTLIDVLGDDHSPTFTVRADVGVLTATGTGNSKVTARKVAATKLLDVMRSSQPDDQTPIKQEKDPSTGPPKTIQKKMIMDRHFVRVREHFATTHHIGNVTFSIVVHEEPDESVVEKLQRVLDFANEQLCETDATTNSPD